MNLLSAFLLDKIGLICEQIPPEEFEELTECAYEGLENKIPLGDHHSISIKEEYKMRIPRRFSAWMTNTVHEKMTRHCREYGFYNMPREGLFIPMMWVNRMKKGDQHQVHQHNNSLYSFSAYISCSNNDAPFFFMHSDHIEYLQINEHSCGNTLIFPSSLPHSVAMKTNDGERISVSGNIVFDWSLTM